MKRLINLFKAFFNFFMDKVEDPEMLLDQARRDLQEKLVANRERAVAAVTQKNRLQMMLEEAKKQVENNDRQVLQALEISKRKLAAGDAQGAEDARSLAKQFVMEKTRNEALVAQLQVTYGGAEATVDNVKKAIKQQEQEVRKKASEILALKAQWKSAQVQNEINKSLEEFTFENFTEGFGAAEEKIKMKQSEAAARGEMLSESIAGKTRDMEDQAWEMEAESKLSELERNLGITTPAQPSTTSADDELNKLEQSLKV